MSIFTAIDNAQSAVVHRKKEMLNAGARWFPGRDPAKCGKTDMLPDEDPRGYSTRDQCEKDAAANTERRVRTAAMAKEAALQARERLRKIANNMMAPATPDATLDEYEQLLKNADAALSQSGPEGDRSIAHAELRQASSAIASCKGRGDKARYAYAVLIAAAAAILKYLAMTG